MKCARYMKSGNVVLILHSKSFLKKIILLSCDSSSLFLEADRKKPVYLPVVHISRRTIMYTGFLCCLHKQGDVCTF
jgi:hypothetical protein